MVNCIFCLLQMDAGIDLFRKLPFLMLVLCMSCLLMLRCVRDPACGAGCCLLPPFCTDLVRWTCLIDGPQLVFIVFLLKKLSFCSSFHCAQSFAFPPVVLRAPCVAWLLTSFFLCLVRLTYQTLDSLGKVGTVSPSLLLAISEIVLFNRNVAPPSLSFPP